MSVPVDLILSLHLSGSADLELPYTCNDWSPLLSISPKEDFELHE